MKNRLGKQTESEFVGLHGNVIFNFLRNILFSTMATTLSSHQKSASISPEPHERPVLCSSGAECSDNHEV